MDREGIREILAVTENHPYYTQLLCHVLWDRFRPRGVLTKEDVAAGVDEVFLREAHAFHDLWDMLPVKARQLLATLAHETNSDLQVYSAEFLLKYHLGPASSVQRAMARLLAEEILEKANGGYQFTDVFFRRWVEREFPRP